MAIANAPLEPLPAPASSPSVEAHASLVTPLLASLPVEIPLLPVDALPLLPVDARPLPPLAPLLLAWEPLPPLEAPPLLAAPVV